MADIDSLNRGLGAGVRVAVSDAGASGTALTEGIVYELTSDCVAHVRMGGTGDAATVLCLRLPAGTSIVVEATPGSSYLSTIGASGASGFVIAAPRRTPSPT